MRTTYANVGATAERPRRKADRGGKDNSGDVQALCDRYGFRGIEFGNWVRQKERGLYVTRVDIGLDQLLEILGWPERSFNKIGPSGIALAFGARGRGGFIKGSGGASAIAHFEPGNFAINLTRTENGLSINSFVHELGHALDWHLGEGRSFYSDGDEWASVIEQMPEYLARCCHLNMPSRPSGRKDGYWTRPTEVFARSFEVYVKQLGYKGVLAHDKLTRHPEGAEADIAANAIAPLFDRVSADIGGRQ